MVPLRVHRRGLLHSHGHVLHCVPTLPIFSNSVLEVRGRHAQLSSLPVPSVSRQGHTFTQKLNFPCDMWCVVWHFHRPLQALLEGYNTRTADCLVSILDMGTLSNLMKESWERWATTQGRSFAASLTQTDFFNAKGQEDELSLGTPAACGRSRAPMSGLGGGVGGRGHFRGSVLYPKATTCLLLLGSHEVFVTWFSPIVAQRAWSKCLHNTAQHSPETPLGGTICFCDIHTKAVPHNCC